MKVIEVKGETIALRQISGINDNEWSVTREEIGKGCALEDVIPASIYAGMTSSYLILSFRSLSIFSSGDTSR